MTGNSYGTAVIGGGFYGCFIAAFLSEAGQRTVLLEKEDDLLKRASYSNQARVHNGYHYPRNLVTAARSDTNFPRFVDEFRNCIDNSFVHLYGIARNNSKTNQYQFRKLCSFIGLKVEAASPDLKKIFDMRLLEEV